VPGRDEKEYNILLETHSVIHQNKLSVILSVVLYGCETWSITVAKNTEFENEMLMRM
jgi:hypothetical protein